MKYTPEYFDYVYGLFPGHEFSLAERDKIEERIDWLVKTCRIQLRIARIPSERLDGTVRAVVDSFVQDEFDVSNSKIKQIAIRVHEEALNAVEIQNKTTTWTYT